MSKVIYRTHKIRLNPNNAQRGKLLQACGVSRFAYNWALTRSKKQYLLHKEAPLIALYPSDNWLNAQLNRIKREEFPWMWDVTKYAPQTAIQNLGEAFHNFFKGNGKYPRFKKKGRSVDSFSMANDAIAVKGRKVRIPKLGWVRMREELRFKGKIAECTIIRGGNHWYACFVMKTEAPKQHSIPNGKVGIDLGIRNLATLSDGWKAEPLRNLAVSLPALRRSNQSLARKEQGSRNWYKALRRYRNVHARIANQRADSIHKFTTELANRYEFIAIEDLNVSAMTRKGKGGKRGLNRGMLDAAFGGVRRKLEYKTEERGTALVAVHRFFPSSKLCSKCGSKNQTLTRGQSSWKCITCKTLHDRDVNAAVNILNEALRIMAGGPSVAACGGVGSDLELVQDETQAVEARRELEAQLP